MTTGEVRNVLDTHRRRRPLRILAYSALTVGSAVLLIDPTKSLQGQEIWIRWIWSGFLLVGTLLAIVGSIRDWYISELVGVAALLTALAAFVVLLFAAWNTGAVAFGCFLLSLMIVLASRGLDTLSILSASIRAERRHR